jgi:hypothetical protein
MTTRAPMCMLLGGALGVLLPRWAHAPIVLYAPVERTFRLATLASASHGHPPPIEITFYGVYLCAALCAAFGALLGRAWERARPTASSSLLTALALAALGVATVYQLSCA